VCLIVGRLEGVLVCIELDLSGGFSVVLVVLGCFRVLLGSSEIVFACMCVRLDTLVTRWITYICVFFSELITALHYISCGLK
jgi:hypothetical protein